MFDFLKHFSKELNNANCTAIIAAAGNGTRMGEGNKLLIEILGRPVLAYTIEAFEMCELVDEIIIAAKEEDIVEYGKIIKDNDFQKVSKIILGGDERQDSVNNGLKEINEQCEIVLIHDGARPLISPEVIEEAILQCVQHQAVVVGVPIKDTIKTINDDFDIIDTPDRNNLWIAQTPQVFSKDIIINAYEKAKEDGYISTDDSALVERLGIKIKMIEGEYQNIKLTTKEDVKIIESFLGGIL